MLIIALYILACVYLGRRITKLMPTRLTKAIAIICVVVLSTMFFTQRMIASHVAQSVNMVLYIVSTMWLIVIMYGVVLFVLFDIARLIARLRTHTRRPITRGNILTILILLALIITVGIVNAYSPVVTRYTVSLPQYNRTDTLRLAIVSDLHMGYAVRSGDMQKLCEMVNNEHVDACLIAGDLFDGEVTPVITNDLGAPLRDIKTTYGTYAVVGNHDYMGDINVAKDYIRTLNMTLLCDSTATFDGVAVVGRNDLSGDRMPFMMSKKKVLSDFVQKTDTMPMIVIDHQPARIDESVSCGADIHISGHTHAGQVWPMRMITKMVFDLDYGYRQYTNTHAIVTSGFGTWGPRMRLGNSPEIVILTVTF